MKVILQRTSQASVTVAGEVISQIGPGWLALLGIAVDDTLEHAVWLADKVANLRAFEDDDGKMNRSVIDLNGEILVVSNFTLYADCQKGRRPSFIAAARPDVAEPLVTAFARNLRLMGLRVSEGRFGADMNVALINDGPVTLTIETPESRKRAP
jgi:D-aminoacyl-tRNA deacylase